MQVQVRPVRVQDITAITAIYRAQMESGVATYEYDPPDACQMQQRMQDIVTQGYPYLVAICADRVAGHTYASSHRARRAYRYTVENTMYVDEALQGHGIGATLLQSLIDDCSMRGFRQMIAVVGESANTGSVRLHERLGLRTVGVFQGIGRKHGRWLNTLQMQRALGDGDASDPDDE